MKRASLKSDLRHVRDTFSRFAAIMAIIALGVAIFSGIKGTAPDMRRTAENYYNQSDFMDFKLLSTIGFNEDDVAAIRKTANVSGVQPSYSVDASVPTHNGSLTVKLHSLDLDKLKTSSPDNIDYPQITSGRMPQTASECLADPRFMVLSGMQLGDSVTFSSGKDKDISEYLSQSTYTIVGVARCPLYISYDRGSSSIGTGAVNAYFFIPYESYTLDVYTEVYLTVANPTHISRFDGKYDDLVKPVDDALVSLGKNRSDIRYEELTADGTKKLTDAKSQLADGEQKLTDGAKKIADAQAKIDDGQTQLTKAENDFDKKILDGQKKLDDSQKEYNSGMVKWTTGSKKLKTARATYTSGLKALEAAKEKVGLGGRNAADLDILIRQIEALLALLPPEARQYPIITEQLKSLNTLLENQKKIEAAGVQLTRGAKQLASAKKQLDAAKIKLDEGAKALADGKAEGQLEISKQKTKLAQAIEELTLGRQEYDTQKAKAQPMLDEARQAIADGQKQLDSLKNPSWYVLGFDTNPGFVTYKEDADRIAAIGVVFPLIFFLVAALVSLTTMTRLVEDERTHIGTLKALGYSRSVVASKYLLYAISASLAGSVIGVLAGFNIFPRVIFKAYQILYTLPNMQPTFNLYYACISTIAAVACAALPAWLVCVQSLRATPAALMLPKAPLPGKRILLEHIGFIWKRLKFTQKVTCRNLFLYKKRLFMTVVGVAGCTALILTGFGIMDSISSIVSRQFGEIRTFNVEADLMSNPSKEDMASLNQVLKDPAVQGSLMMHQQTVDALIGSATKSVYLVVPQQGGAFTSFIHLRQRSNGQKLTLDDQTVIITEKFAMFYKLAVGDVFTIRDGDGVLKQVKIGGIAENYIYHYVYMSPALYASLFGKTPAPNQLMCNVSAAGMDTVCKNILGQKAVLELTQIAKLEDTFRKMIGALRYVVVVLIVSAALLAFVVLFSLTNINIDERARELATIKVLGFYTREMASYIYRENIALTFIGTVFGLVLGIFLEHFVIVTAEVDLVMFGRAISWSSYALSALLTFFFAALVNLVMMFRLRKIDMATTLKSNE